MRKSGLILLLLMVLCSCHPGGGIIPSSELCLERLDINHFPLECSGITRADGQVTLRYRFQARDCLCSAYPVFVCPEPQLWSVTVNGMPVTPEKRSDGEGRYVISGIVHEGENLIELQGTGSIVPVFLTGEFDVFSAGESGWYLDSQKVLEPGSFTAQGLPFYAGEISCTRQYEVPQKVGKRIFRLAGWKGGSCALWINYVKVADIGTDPFEMNVGPCLQPGPNDVEVRIGAPSDGGDFGLYQDFTLE